MVEAKQEYLLQLTIVEAQLTRNVELVGKMDPYAILKVAGQ